jgi:protein arginine kinase
MPMNLDSLTQTSGEWLRSTGAEHDIVISSRIRLARNLSSFPFTNRASPHQKTEIEQYLKARIEKLDFDPSLTYLNLSGLSMLDRQLLVERQLISRELANSEGPRGVAFAPNEIISVMVNEEDHIRMQVIRSGFSLDEAWQDADRLDDKLEEKVPYAFSEELGYLTACPTNVGTGLRASVMLHLPALVLIKQIEKVFRALQKINLAVRGLYGEGSRASGDFYQISNQVTLGKSETTIINEIRDVIPNIIAYERQARQALTRENRPLILDRVQRAFGTLKNAAIMTSEETMDLLSSVRLGVNLGLLDDIKINDVNELFIHTQPAHLQKLLGKELDSEARNSERARFLRNRLRELNDHMN